MSFEERFQVLFMDIDASKICTMRPNCVMQNCGFVIDRSTLRDPDDWLCTDLGSFERRGASARVFEIEDNQIINSYGSKGRKEDLSKLKANELTVKTVTARHRKYTDFTRTATVVLDNTGMQMGLVIRAADGISSIFFSW